MMQDYVRTGTYQRAILQNHSDFKDKVSPAPSPLIRPRRYDSFGEICLISASGSGSGRVVTRRSWKRHLD